MGLRPYRRKPEEMQAKRIASAAPADSHSPGWPHISLTGNCLCNKRCCIGPTGGCHCTLCTHQSHPREELVPA